MGVFFFTPLDNRIGRIDGRFHAGTGYVGGDTPTVGVDTPNGFPPEVSGTFSIMDGNGDELKGGFLGDLR